MTTAMRTQVQDLEAAHVLQIYKRANVVFERGEGVRLYDTTGKAYLDFISGVGVCSLGHGHARLAAAIADQAKTLAHTSNLFYHPLQGELATRLSALTGLDPAGTNYSKVSEFPNYSASGNIDYVASSKLLFSMRGGYYMSDQHDSNVTEQPLYRWTNWQIPQKTQEFQKLDARTIQFPLKLAAGAEGVVRYTVQYTW